MQKATRVEVKAVTRDPSRLLSLQDSYATIGRHTLRCPRVEVASKRAKTDEGGRYDASLARAFVNG